MIDLPIELWIRILDLLPRESRKLLYPVNRTFMDIILAEKYRKVRVGDFLARFKEKRILRYIEHISKPQIVQYIRHITIVLAPDVVLVHRPAVPGQAMADFKARAAMKYPGWGGIGYPVKKIGEAVASFLSQASNADSLSIGGWRNATDEPLSGLMEFIWNRFSSRDLTLSFHATSTLSATSALVRERALSKVVTSLLNHTAPTIRSLSLISTTGSSFSPNAVLPRLNGASNLTNLRLELIGSDEEPHDFAIIHDFVIRNSAKLTSLEFTPQELAPAANDVVETSITKGSTPLQLISLSVLPTYLDTPASTSVKNIRRFIAPSRYTLTSLTLSDGFIYLSELREIISALDPDCNALTILDARVATITPQHLEFLTKTLLNLTTLTLRSTTLLHDVTIETECIVRNGDDMTVDTGITMPKLFFNKLEPKMYPHPKLSCLSVERTRYHAPLPPNWEYCLRTAIPSLAHRGAERQMIDHGVSILLTRFTTTFPGGEGYSPDSSAALLPLKLSGEHPLHPRHTISSFIPAVMSSELIIAASNLLEQRFPDKVYRPESEEYGKDVFHFLGTASLPSACSIRPSSIEDVAEILKIIGRDDIRCPFAVKSGGHSGNSGFSSTNGIQISMANFKEITYDKKSQTVRVGSGLLWEQVYAALDKYNVTVVGGRIAGVGTGLLLGGGFSWITEEYGLSIDTIVAYDLVLPDGSYVEVTENSDPDLFFALKGGCNNFGIVTTFTLNAFPIGKVWAGVITYSLDYNERLLQAISNFSIGNTDIKAEIIASYTFAGPAPVWQLLLFYNGPLEPKVFQSFLEIPALSKDVGPRSLADFVELTRMPPFQGGTAHTVPIRQYTLPVLKQIQESWNELSSNASRDSRSLTAAVFMVEPFTQAFKHSTPSAYPHSPDRMLTPSLLFVTFANPDDATYFDAALRKATQAIQLAAIGDGQTKPDDICYPNYALADTPLELLYGENLPRLKDIRAKYDPKNIMGLTGGFKL